MPGAEDSAYDGLLSEANQKYAKKWADTSLSIVVIPLPAGIDVYKESKDQGQWAESKYKVQKFTVTPVEFGCSSNLQFVKCRAPVLVSGSTSMFCYEDATDFSEPVPLLHTPYHTSNAVQGPLACAKKLKLEYSKQCIATC